MRSLGQIKYIPEHFIIGNKSSLFVIKTPPFSEKNSQSSN